MPPEVHTEIQVYTVTYQVERQQEHTSYSDGDADLVPGKIFWPTDLANLQTQ